MCDDCEADDGDGFARNGILGVDVEDEEEDDDVVGLPFREFCEGGDISVADVSPVWIRCNRSLILWMLSCEMYNAGCQIRS